MSFKALKTAWILAICLCSFGCDGERAEGIEQSSETVPVDIPATPEPGVDAPADQTETEPTQQMETDAPELQRPVTRTRIRKRLNIDQLGQAILSASDGIQWSQGNDEDLLSTLAFTLGKPDYFEVTSEDLGTTVLFMKFLEDAAGSVCRQMVERDLETGSQYLIGPSDAIPEQIESLVLRFHSRQLDTQHPDLKQWIWLYDTALRISNSDVDAWRTLCVALIRHPDFYTY